MRVVLRRAAEGETLQFLTIHPASAGSDDMVTSIESKPAQLNTIENVLFYFGDEAELIPGLWRMEIRLGNRILATQAFAVRVDQ